MHCEHTLFIHKPVTWQDYYVSFWITPLFSLTLKLVDYSCIYLRHLESILCLEIFSACSIVFDECCVQRKSLTYNAVFTWGMLLFLHAYIITTIVCMGYNYSSKLWIQLKLSLNAFIVWAYIALGLCSLNSKPLYRSEFNKYLGSTAAEVPVKYRSVRASINPNIAASKLREILRQDILPLSD